MIKNKLFCFLLGALFFVWNDKSYAEAQKFSELVAFGDSLTDMGNACHDGKFHLLCFLQSKGRFTNGKLWIEYLSEKLNLPIKESRKGGKNFAFAGATSAFVDKSTPGLGAQVETYLKRPRPLDSSNILYIVWIGGNDLKNKIARLSFIKNMDDLFFEDLLANIEKNIRILARKGGKYFLVPNLPPVNRTPIAATILSSVAKVLSGLFWILDPQDNQQYKENDFALENTLSFSFEAIIGYYNWHLEKMLEKLEGELDIKIYKPDLFHHLRTTTRQPEFQNRGIKKLFYDSFHPSAIGHKLIADEVLKILEEG